MENIIDLDMINGVEDLEYLKAEDPFRFLKQGFYCLGDDVPEVEPFGLFGEEWYDEDLMLEECYGEYYTDGEYLKEGFTKEDLLEWIDYNSSYYNCCSGYGYGYSYGYDAYEYHDDLGKEAPEHSVAKTVNIGRQQGPKCSAYASSCLLGFYGKEVKAKDLYRRFFKLPDGSAVPSSVAKVIGAKLRTNGKISDIEKLIDEGKPVMVLAYYDKTPEWDNLHYMLVTGYDDENIYLADSLHSSGERYYNRKVDKKTFRKMWNTSRSFLVRFFYGKNLYYEYNP